MTALIGRATAYFRASARYPERAFRGLPSTHCALALSTDRVSEHNDVHGTSRRDAYVRGRVGGGAVEAEVPAASAFWAPPPHGVVAQRRLFSTVMKGEENGIDRAEQASGGLYRYRYALGPGAAGLGDCPVSELC